MLAYIEAKQT